MITVIPDQEEHFMTSLEITGLLKGLAAFLEMLPADARLANETGTITYVPNPHLCAQALRLFLPSEGHA